MLLGGHALMAHVIEKARELGVYTIVTDYVPNAPAKRLADESYDISTTDVDALVRLAKELGVDGVFTGYADSNLVPCCEICSRLGMPFYATLKQLDQTMHKNHFKELCKKHGIKVVDSIDAEMYLHHKEQIPYPVIVKPADSYASKGISVCFNPDDLKACMEKALHVSACKEIVIEKYIKADDIYCYFTVQNGIVSLSAMADRALNEEQPGYAPQPVGYFFPSKYLNLYERNVHDKLQHMISDLGLLNGSFFMQGFVQDDEILFFEMGLRLSGGAGYLQIRHQNQIDQVEMHIRYALTGVFGNWSIEAYDKPDFAKPACVVVILLKNGRISRIEGLEKIRRQKEVFHILQMRQEGETINAKGTLNQVFARIYLCAEHRVNLRNAVRLIGTELKVLDENGCSMILNLFDPDQI